MRGTSADPEEASHTLSCAQRTAVTCATTSVLAETAPDTATPQTPRPEQPGAPDTRLCTPGAAPALPAGGQGAGAGVPPPRASGAGVQVFLMEVSQRPVLNLAPLMHAVRILLVGTFPVTCSLGADSQIRFPDPLLLVAWTFLILRF